MATLEERLSQLRGRTLEQRISALQDSQAKSANYVAREFTARGAANALLALPSASGDLLAGAGALVEGLSAPLAGEDMALKRRYAEQQNKFPASLLRSIPRPTVGGITAAVKSAPSLMPGGETPGEAYDRNLFAFEQEEGDMRRAHPVAALAGDVGGDALSLLIGRRGTGADKTMQRVETRLIGRAAVERADSMAEDLGKVLEGSTMRRLARGAGRSIESGLEAAVLDIVKDPNADPLETAALAAGGQMAGSGFLSGAQGLVSGGLLKAAINITVAAASTWGLVQVLKSATPGGEDRILESMESGYDKVALALGLGAASAALGATRYGRGNTHLSDQTRTFLDGISTVHRGTTLSLLTEWTEGDPQDRAAIERALTAVSQDPTYEGKTEAERSIVRRIRSGAGLERYRTGGEF